MEFCPRCDGGVIIAPTCPVCSGSGFIDSATAASPSYTIPSPFRKAATASRLGREEEKRRKVKSYKQKGVPYSEVRNEKSLNPQAAKIKKTIQGPQASEQRTTSVKKSALKTPNYQTKLSRKELSEKYAVNTVMSDQLTLLKQNAALSLENGVNKKTKKKKKKKKKKKRIGKPLSNLHRRYPRSGELTKKR